MAASYEAHKQPVTVVSFDNEDDMPVDFETEQDEDACPFPVIPRAENSTRASLLRYKIYKRAWTSCQACINSILSDIYDTLIAEIRTFVTEVHPCQSPLKRAVPTGLILGANQTLSDALTYALKRSLAGSRRGGPSAIFARLSSRDCPNRKVALRALIQACRSSLPSGDVEVEAQRRVGGRKPALTAADDLNTLLAWYRLRFEYINEKPKIIVYLEDPEAFDTNVLCDLIYAMSCYQADLPFVILFAISTSIDAMHTLLPRAMSELLRVVSFPVTESSETFHRLIQELFINRQQALNLSSNTFALLRDTFLSYDQSINTVIAKIRYMYMCHFFGDPVAVLTGLTLLDDEAMLSETEYLKSIVEDLQPFILALPSFQRHAEESEHVGIASGSISQLRDSFYLARAVQEAGEEYKHYSVDLKHGWVLFEVLQNTWVEGRISAETMVTEYYNGKLISRAQRLCGSLKRSQDEKISDFLQRALASLQGQGLTDSCHLQKLCDELSELIANGQRQTGRNNFVNGNELGGTPRTEGDKSYTRLVAEIAQRLDDFLTVCFRPYSRLTFHELWYFDGYQSLRSSFHPPISTHIRAAIARPSSRVPKSLVTLTEAEAEALERLDLCTTNRLLLEAGKLVNLADWYGAFETVRLGVEEIAPMLAETPSKRKAPPTNGMSGQRPTRHRKNEDDSAEGKDQGTPQYASRKEQQEAAFINAVAELGFIGFIQPTKRKAEHVARSVF